MTNRHMEVEVQLHFSSPRQYTEVRGQLHALATLPPVPIGWEAGWAPESVWTLWRKEKSCTAGNQTQAIQPIAIQTELSQLLAWGHDELKLCNTVLFHHFLGRPQENHEDLNAPSKFWHGHSPYTSNLPLNLTCLAISNRTLWLLPSSGKNWYFWLHNKLHHVEGSYLPGNYAMQSGKSLLMFQRNTVLPFSELNSKPSKQQTASLLLGLLFNPEETKSTFLWKVGNYRLHCITFQKCTLIATSIRTSNITLHVVSVYKEIVMDKHFARECVHVTSANNIVFVEITFL
jgi:hypothetical protein